MLAAICVALAASSASAAIINSVLADSTTGISGITSWPVAFTDDTPLGSNPSANATAEGNYGGASLFSLAQSWTATTNGVLTNLQMAITGAGGANFNVALYDGGTSGWADIGSGTYTPGTNVSNNLFTDTSTQTFAQYNVPGANAAVLSFALSGADQVPIVAGHQYIFEVSATTNIGSQMLWFRNGADAGNYAAGQGFRQRSPVNGNARRDFSLAATVVPEASSIVLASIGCCLVGFCRRRAKQGTAS
jgi:hypothetical protein